MNLLDYKSILNRLDETQFENYCLQIFHFQYQNNPIYKQYVDTLGVAIEKITEINDIPFLPIQFFKNFKIKTTNFDEETFFESSGTTGIRSKHFIEDVDFYNQMSLKNAQSFFHSLRDKIILALLPTYHENQHASLIAMIDFFIKNAHPDSCYILGNEEMLEKCLANAKNQIVLFGVSYALLDLDKKLKNINMSAHVVVETGGMKGKRKELPSEQLHQILSQKFKTSNIFTEYGMTELMSQAWGKFNQIKFPPWCRVLIRNLHDPFDVSFSGTGALNIIDLANVHSCAFIATQDIGRVKDHLFTVLGRMDESDIRGCNQLLEK